MSNWTDLVIIHGNIEGARAAFEHACEKIIQWKNPSKTVRGIRVHQGDGGIDVYVGDFGTAPIDVYQCKYFIDGIDDSQKQQIRNSYKTAVSSTDFKVNDWYLCLPINLSIQETQWFEGWAKSLTPSPILVPPSDLLVGAEMSGLASLIFKRNDSLKLDRIIEDLKISRQDPWFALVAQTEEDCFKILLKLIRMHNKCIAGQYPHLDTLYSRAEAGDRLDACEYIKSTLAGSAAMNHKVWLFNMLTDFTCEPIAYRFILRYDALIEKARELDHLRELSTSEFYSTWSLLRSPALEHIRDMAQWKVKFV